MGYKGHQKGTSARSTQEAEVHVVFECRREEARGLIPPYVCQTCVAVP